MPAREDQTKRCRHHCASSNTDLRSTPHTPSLAHTLKKEKKGKKALRACSCPPRTRGQELPSPTLKHPRIPNRPRRGLNPNDGDRNFHRYQASFFFFANLIKSSNSTPRPAPRMQSLSSRTASHESFTRCLRTLPPEGARYDEGEARETQRPSNIGALTP